MMPPRPRARLAGGWKAASTSSPRSSRATGSRARPRRIAPAAGCQSRRCLPTSKRSGHGCRALLTRRWRPPAPGRSCPRAPRKPRSCCSPSRPAATRRLRAGPIGGEAWELTKRMLAAIGVEPEQAYVANIACFYSPGAKLSPEQLGDCGEAARRHVTLARPKRLLLLGDSAGESAARQAAGRGPRPCPRRRRGAHRRHLPPAPAARPAVGKGPRLERPAAADGGTFVVRRLAFASAALAFAAPALAQDPLAPLVPGQAPAHRRPPPPPVIVAPIVVIPGDWPGVFAAIRGGNWTGARDRHRPAAAKSFDRARQGRAVHRPQLAGGLPARAAGADRRGARAAAGRATGADGGGAGRDPAAAGRRPPPGRQPRRRARPDPRPPGVAASRWPTTFAPGSSLMSTPTTRSAPNIW